MSDETMETTPFLSYISLRDTHRELVLQQRDLNLDDPQVADSFWTAVANFLHRGEAAGAYLDLDEERQSAQNLLDYWSNRLFHVRRDAPEAILMDFDPHTQPEIPESRRPYVGLEAFTAQNSHLFFGRNELINKFLQKINEHQLIAAIGPSGSGKSSVVLAGLLPRLQKGALPSSQNWHYFPPIVPGATPLIKLARLLRPEDTPETEWVLDVIEKLSESGDHLTQLVEGYTDAPAVIVIDQFEETFTLCHDREEQRAFMESLLRLTTSRQQRHIVILTMRVDYEKFLFDVPLFQALFEQGEERVAAMNAGELREAIEKPADLVGLKFDEGLVDAIIREILGEPAALPLLQFTLLQLWDNRERNRVTWETYRRLGGVMKALGNTADQIYESLLPEEQTTMRRIFLRIVRPTAGLEFMRRRVQRRVLYQSGEAPDRIDRVINKLVEARLVRLTPGATAEDDQIEVAHEALVRNWPLLGEWLEEAAEQLQQRQRFAHQVEEWARTGRDENALLRGQLLQEAAKYDDLSPVEAEFIARSEAAEEAERLEQEALRQRELAQAKTLAAAKENEAQALHQKNEALALAARRNRYLSIALILVLIGTVIAMLQGVYSLRQRNAALEARTALQSADATAVAAEVAALKALAEQATAQVAQQTAVAEQAIAEAQRQTAEAEQATSVLQLTQSYTEIETRNAEEIYESTVNAVAIETQNAVNARATVNAVATQDAQQTATATYAPPPAVNATPTPPLSATEISATRVNELQTQAVRNSQIRERDNMPMVFISGSTFVMGANQGDQQAEVDEQPAHRVTLGDFYFDQYEVSVFQFATFLNSRRTGINDCAGELCGYSRVQTIYSSLKQNRDGVFAPLDGYGNTPINHVSWYGAQAYCAWATGDNGRLPTEAEWEFAARWTDSRLYPWGDVAPDQDRAVFNLRAFFPDSIFDPLLTVDALPNGRSPYNVYGMAGGVMEWVLDWYQANYYSIAPTNGRPNTDDSSGLKVLRGGYWANNAADIRASNRSAAPPLISDATESWGYGFRCMRPAP